MIIVAMVVAIIIIIIIIMILILTITTAIKEALSREERKDIWSRLKEERKEGEQAQGKEADQVHWHQAKPRPRFRGEPLL